MAWLPTVCRSPRNELLRKAGDASLLAFAERDLGALFNASLATRTLAL